MPAHQVEELVEVLVDESMHAIKGSSLLALVVPEVQPEQLYLQTASQALLVCSLNEIPPGL